jgi:hypothetical protein
MTDKFLDFYMSALVESCSGIYTNNLEIYTGICGQIGETFN